MHFQNLKFIYQPAEWLFIDYTIVLLFKYKKLMILH